MPYVKYNMYNVHIYLRMVDVWYGLYEFKCILHKDVRNTLDNENTCKAMLKYTRFHFEFYWLRRKTRVKMGESACFKKYTISVLLTWKFEYLMNSFS